MILKREPAQIESVAFDDNILKVTCKCLSNKDDIAGTGYRPTDVPGKMAIELCSPSPKVISVKIINRNINERANNNSLIDIRASATGSVDQNDNELIFKTGMLEARIPKQGTFAIRFFNNGVQIANTSDVSGIYYKSSSALAGGIVSRKNSSTGISFDMRPDERIYGLGSSSSALVRNGADCSTVKSGVSSCDEIVPFYLSSAGYGLYVGTQSKVDISVGGSNAAVNMETPGDSIEYVFMAGDDLSEVMSLYSQITGTPDSTPARVVSGLSLNLDGNYQITSDRILSELTILRDSGIRVSEIWLGNSWHPSSDPVGFRWDGARFPDPVLFARKLHDLGVCLGLSVNPYISEDSEEFDEVRDDDLLLKDKDGNALLCETESGTLGILDMRNLLARSYVIKQLDDLFKAGCDRFESDYRGALADRFADLMGDGADEYLSVFPSVLNVAIAETVIRQQRRGDDFIIADSFANGDQRLNFINVYPSGKPSYTSLSAVLRKSLSLGLSGFTAVNIDVPDIMDSDPSLFARWMQLAVYAPHFRMATNDRMLSSGAAAFQSVSTLSDIRASLAPYIYSTICEGSKYGLPSMRAMALEFPNDIAAKNFECQYMLGSSLLVCPVLNKSGRSIIYIPQGTWTDFMTREKIRGPQYLVRNYDSSTIPVFVRPNSIIATKTPGATQDSGMLDGLTFTCFELAQNSVAACEVFAENGVSSGIINVSCESNKIIVRTNGLGQNKRIVLSDITGVVSVSESIPEQTQFGTMIEFTSNELIITLG